LHTHTPPATLDCCTTHCTLVPFTPILPLCFFITLSSRPDHGLYAYPPSFLPAVPPCWILLPPAPPGHLHHLPHTTLCLWFCVIEQFTCPSPPPVNSSAHTHIPQDCCKLCHLGLGPCLLEGNPYCPDHILCLVLCSSRALTLPAQCPMQTFPHCPPHTPCPVLTHTQFHTVDRCCAQVDTPSC